MVVVEGVQKSPAMTAASMVERYLRPRGIEDLRVLEAMARVPRPKFVPETLRERAYSDHPLPIGHDQTISQPYIVALMTQALGLRGSEKVLEIGTGSGYQTAVLAELARSVFSVERIRALAAPARQRLEDLGYQNFSLRTADGLLGWREYAPFDGILVTASVRSIPADLLGQLAEKGRMVLPLGEGGKQQKLYVIRKTVSGVEKKFLTYCSFVPCVE